MQIVAKQYNFSPPSVIAVGKISFLLAPPNFEIRYPQTNTEKCYRQS